MPLLLAAQGCRIATATVVIIEKNHCFRTANCSPFALGKNSDGHTLDPLWRSRQILAGGVAGSAFTVPNKDLGKSSKKNGKLLSKIIRWAFIPNPTEECQPLYLSGLALCHILMWTSLVQELDHFAGRLPAPSPDLLLLATLTIG